MRHGLALLLALTPAFAAGAQSSDPAYVDSPQNKAVPDPARADHGVFATVESRRYAEDAQLARNDAERMAEAERSIQAQIERFSAAQAAANQPSGAMDTGSDPSLPPVGGRSLAREVRAQLGQGLMQDAADALDARIQRETRSDAWNGRPPPPGTTPPQGAGGP
jgi:hypothetical protein